MSPKPQKPPTEIASHALFHTNVYINTYTYILVETNALKSSSEKP